VASGGKGGLCFLSQAAGLRLAWAIAHVAEEATEPKPFGLKIQHSWGGFGISAQCCSILLGSPASGAE